LAVIDFEHVSKAYRLGASRMSMREALAQLPRKLFSRNGAQADDHMFLALDDVSFQVEAGEVLGIIGHNGAGKSTILKLLSRVAFPTRGHIHTRGRMAALIELGAGFHPDLSGRENIYLNGSILGLKRTEIEARFSDIVEFSELGTFIDTPVKRYSSGMYVRLAFAVAAHVTADILLVDEVLSVGDMSFQRKCLAKMAELRDSGVTIVYISHNMWSVSNFCGRALLLRRGKIAAEGATDDVIQRYRQLDREDMLSAGRASAIPEAQAGKRLRSDESVITKIELLTMDRQPAKEFGADEQFIVRCHYDVPERLEHPMFVIRVNRFDGLLCCAVASPKQGVRPVSGAGVFEAVIGPLHLLPDYYSVQPLIGDRIKTVVYMPVSSESFRIKGELLGENSGVFGVSAEWLTL